VRVPHVASVALTQPELHTKSSEMLQQSGVSLGSRGSRTFPPTESIFDASAVVAVPAAVASAVPVAIAVHAVAVE